MPERREQTEKLCKRQNEQNILVGDAVVGRVPGFNLDCAELSLIERGAGWQGGCWDTAASSFMVLNFLIGQNLYLSKEVNFSDHFLSNVTESGNGLFSSRSDLGELCPSFDFKVVDREHSNLTRMAELLRTCQPNHISYFYIPVFLLLWLP